jgi:hypothetical protein
LGSALSQVDFEMAESHLLGMSGQSFLMAGHKMA